jgi:hypothetical protein
MSVLFSLPITRALDNTGTALPGAQLYFFATGTSNPKTVYLDSTLSTAATHPVLADSAGRFPALWMDGTAYTVKLLNSAGTQIWSVDGVGQPRFAAATVNTNTPSGATAYKLPVYNESGTLIGYVPVYSSAW